MNLEVISLYDLDNKALTYTNGEATVKISVPKNEEGLGLIIKNLDTTTAAVIKLKAGNSIYAVGDLTVSVPKSSEMMFNLKNTGRYKNVSGDDAGSIVLNISGVTASNVSLCAFEL